MSDFLDKIGLSVIKTQEQGLDLLEKLIATARPNAVFGQPVTGGDYTVISAAEVSCGLGVGFGGGGGGAPMMSQPTLKSRSKARHRRIQVAARSDSRDTLGPWAAMALAAVAAASLPPDRLRRSRSGRMASTLSRSSM